MPTINNCDKNKSKTYSGISTRLMPSGNGCKAEVDGVGTCAGCPDENFICECASE